MTISVINGECLAMLREMPDRSVHCCVTSPPYWGLRDYGHAGQLGLELTPADYVANIVDVFREVRRVLRDDGTCWINLGDTYTASGRGGDTGSSNLEGSTESQQQSKAAGQRVGERSSFRRDRLPRQDAQHKAAPALKPKNLVGIPWRVAFALQDDGWYLRQDIIWHKPNPMPESVRDRCTKAHEYIFLLAKSERYFYDADAIAEPISASFANDSRHVTGSTDRNDKEGYELAGAQNPKGPHRLYARSGNKQRKPATERGCPTDGVSGSVPWEGWNRNKRSVWTVTTKPFAGAHFATFPTDLVEPCIRASTSEHGHCATCGAGWMRVIERESVLRTELPADHPERRPREYEAQPGDPYTGQGQRYSLAAHVGWRPSCACYDALYLADFPQPRSPRKAAQRGAWRGRWKRLRARPGKGHWPIVRATVLDIFGGAGTTGLVADRLQRNAILIELNPDYALMARERIAGDAPLFAEVTT